MALLTAAEDPALLLADIDTSDAALTAAIATYKRTSLTTATIRLAASPGSQASGDFLLTLSGLNLPDSLENPGLGSLFSLIQKLTLNRVDEPDVTLLSWTGSLSDFVLTASFQDALRRADFTDLLGLLLRGQDTLVAEYETVDVSAVPALENVTLAGQARNVLGNSAVNDILGNDLGNMIVCGAGNDQARGLGGSDTIYGNDGDDSLYGALLNDRLQGDAGDDALRGGNGRDTLIGGSGRDELWGDFGRNVFAQNKDGESDLLVIKGDQLLFNDLLGKVDDSNGAKCDLIGAIDADDRIIIQGAATEDLAFVADYSWTDANGSGQVFSGIAIFAAGYLEALYVHGQLTVDQIAALVSGDDSQAAINNEQGFYGLA